jgi:hypothetical protein
VVLLGARVHGGHHRGRHHAQHGGFRVVPQQNEVCCCAHVGSTQKVTSVVLDTHRQPCYHLQHIAQHMHQPLTRVELSGTPCCGHTTHIISHRAVSCS